MKTKRRVPDAIWLSVKALADRLGTTPYLILMRVRDRKLCCRVVQSKNGKRRLEVLETSELTTLANARQVADDKLMKIMARKHPLHGCATGS